MADVGWAGVWRPQVIGEGSFNELADIVGPSPYPGQKWVMVNLFTREVKWYQKSQKKSFSGFSRNGWKRGGRGGSWR